MFTTIVILLLLKHLPASQFRTAVAKAIIAAGVLTVVACGKPATAVGSSFRVALLTPGPISDQGWNTGAYNGLLRIRDSLGAQVSHIQVKTPSDFEENFRQYGAAGILEHRT